MNKTFQTVTTILIIILLFLLIWVFVSYYTSPTLVTETTPVVPVVNGNNDVQSPPIIQENINDVQQDVIENGQKNEENALDISEDVLTNTDENIINEENKEENKEQPGSVIISSDPNISNADKQQVLTEIDEALNELLVIVDSVTTVDETRLGIDEEVEVQQ